MPLPTKVIVKGTFVKTAGVIPTTDDVYETGTIRIVSDQWVKSPTLDHLVPPHEVKAELNSVGYFELSVISTDDPLWTPVNRTLVIKESLSGGSRTYRITVPYNTPGGVLNLADVSPVQNPSAPLQYVLLNTVQAKGDLIAGTQANAVARLPIGANAQVLSADSSTATGLKWVTGAGGGGIPPAIINAKGDLIVGLLDDTPDRLGVGTNGQVLKANSAATLGVEWAAESGGGGAVSSVFGRTGAVVAQTGDYTKAQVGLGSVDNTEDTAKPVSTAQQAALDLKANSASPTFTGLVTVNAGLTQNGRYLSVSSALTDAATITVNASLSNDFTVTLGAAVGATRILGTPTSPVGNMRIMIAIRQDATGGRALTYSAAWRFSTSIPLPILSTAPNAVDLLFARYNSTDAVWEVTDFIKASGPGGAISPTIVDAKGDLISATADDTPVRFPVGANGTVLRADSVQSAGLEWTGVAFKGAHSGAAIYEAGDIVSAGSSIFGTVAGAGAGVAPFVATNLLTGTPSNTDTVDGADYEIFSYITVSQRIRMTAITMRKVATQTAMPITVRLWNRDFSLSQPIGVAQITVGAAFAGEVVVPLLFDLAPGINYAVSTTIGLGAGVGYVFNPAFAFPLNVGSVSLVNGGFTVLPEIIVSPTLGNLMWVGIQWEEPNANWTRLSDFQFITSVIGSQSEIEVVSKGNGQWQVGIINSPEIQDPRLTNTQLLGETTAVGRYTSTPDILVDAATIAINAALGNNFTVTLTANRVLGNPSNSIDGQEILVAIRQDATGGRTLTYDTNWRFSASVPTPVLSLTAGATDYLKARYNAADARWDALDFIRSAGTADVVVPVSYPIEGYGFFSITGDVGTFHNSSNTGNNTGIFARLYVPAGKAINSIICAHTTAGTYSGAGGANNGMGIYTAAGVLIEAVKPGATTWQTTAPAWKIFTLASTIPAQSVGRYVYVATLVVAYTVEPNLMFNSVSDFLLKGGNGVGTHRRHFHNNGITDFPASFDPNTYGVDTSGFLPLFALG